jgi:hypothetical protein
MYYFRAINIEIYCNRDWVGKWEKNCMMKTLIYYAIW